VGEYLPVMSTVFTCNQGEQGEHTRVSGPPKRERGQRVRPPTQGTQDVPSVALYRSEGSIQRCASNGVVDDID